MREWEKERVRDSERESMGDREWERGSVCGREKKWEKECVWEREIYRFSRLQMGSNFFQGGPTFSRGCPIAYSL